jgi:hypothetical protein
MVGYSPTEYTMEGDGVLTHKYTTDTEDREIVEKRMSGLYSYSQLAEEYNLSKATIINIVKGYPYNKLKQTDTELVQKLKLQRLEAEKEAWTAFSEHRYVDFGVYAVKWIDLNALVGDNAKNPFAKVVQDSHARNRRKGLRYDALEKLKAEKSVQDVIQDILTKIVDDEWEGTMSELLKKIIEAAKETKVNTAAFPKSPGQLSSIVRSLGRIEIQSGKKRIGCDVRRYVKIKMLTVDGGQVKRKTV